MKSGILSLNKGLFQQQARSILWIAIFFTLALIIMLPLSILINSLSIQDPSEFYRPTTDFNHLFAFSFPFQLVAFATFPVLLGIILVNYTSNKAATDFMHSLPFTRQSILSHSYLIGIASLFIPLLTTAILTAILRPFIKVTFYSWIEILVWLGVSFFIVLFMFIVTITVGMFVGSSLLHGGLTYLIIVLPAVMISLLLVNAQYYVNGLALTAYTEELLTKGIFFVRLAELNYDPFTLLEYGIYTLLAAALVLISYIAYAKRPTEATDQSIVFPFFRYVFLFGLTLFVMLISGFYFSEIQQGSVVWSFIGYLIGAFIGYTILQMILQKTLRLSWPWKGFVSYLAALALLLIPASFIAGFYENKLPDADEVASIVVHNPYTGEQPPMEGLTDEETINQVMALHEALINEGQTFRHDLEAISIKYTLGNGNTLSREYRVDYDTLDQLTEELRNNEEFKRKTEPVFFADRDADILYAEVFDPTGYTADRITDLDNIDELLAEMKKDVFTVPSRALFSYGSYNYIGEIILSRDEHSSLVLPIYSDYTNTIEWMKENGFATGLMLPENIESAIVIPTFNEENRMEIDNVVYGMADLDQLPEPNFVTMDPAQIEILLEVGQQGYYSDYTIVIPAEGKPQHFILGFDAEDVPDFVAEALPLR
ncbi:hypothetical protein [Jeotgalibacillus soli]|uniref:Multidrug ABC transporter permease n=1 Tax=Jeotgalibacillus soli TaxID=889306 RepID=A0A0C2VSC7_9BACL|nr:hypothetical protein [Jeotgalibacillus soli]KIL51832.1 hypothetical protein KP78_02020 [Jeotgalibacillus soli]